MILRRLLLSLAAVLLSLDAQAVTFGTYDLDALGVPRFVNVNYIDLTGIAQVSKFRSSAGHDYHDDEEQCRSMKHYFVAPDATTSIFSPVAGTVSRLAADFVGTQIQIVSDEHPGFIFIIFHVNFARELTVGDHIDEGERLGTHVGTQTLSDIAVGVNTSNSTYRLVSYFDTLTDAAFAAFQARGITSRDQMSFTKGERDADPYTCSGEAFVSRKVAPEEEYVDLSGAQRLAVENPPEQLILADSPYQLVASSTSGLPVVITSADPSVCNVTNSELTLVAAGRCDLSFNQPGNAEYLPARQFRYIITVLSSPQGPRIGSVFTSAPDGSQSFLRFRNTGSKAETVNVSLIDAATGLFLGEWNSPSIPSGAAPQYAMSAIEDGTGRDFVKPPLYTLAIQSKMSGTVQHVLWSAGRSALTNLSICDTGATANPTELANVHSSLLQGGHPSTIVVTNTSATAREVQLGIFDSVTGNRLGTFTTPTVPGSGQITVAVPTIEESAKIPPASSPYHYVIKAEGNFTGYLRHLLTNTWTGFTADMTTACPMRLGSIPAFAKWVGSVYSSAPGDQQSFIRLYNAGMRTGTVTLTLHDASTGVERGQWTSPNITPQMSPQFSIATIESGAGITDAIPASYMISIQSQLDTAYLQHVVLSPTSGALTNHSTCDDGVTTIPTTLINLHSKQLEASHPSTLAATNTSTAELGIGLTIYNSTTGRALAGYVHNFIPRLGTVHIPIATIEARPQFPPSADTPHYNIKPGFIFPGFFQHLVTNIQAGVTTDMTAVCRLN